MFITQSIARVRAYRQAQGWSILRFTTEAGLGESTIRAMDHNRSGRRSRHFEKAGNHYSRRLGHLNAGVCVMRAITLSDDNRHRLSSIWIWRLPITKLFENLLVDVNSVFCVRCLWDFLANDSRRQCRSNYFVRVATFHRPAQL